MVEHNPPAPADRSRTPVIPLPIASMSPVNSFLSSTTGDSPAADLRSVGKGSFQRKQTSLRQRVPKRFCAHAKISARVSRLA
jgi:hypothetical protein